MNLNIYAYIAIGVAVLCLLFGLYFKYSQNKIEDLTAQVKLQEVAIATRDEAIKLLVKDTALIQEVNKVIAETKENNAEARKKLVDTLSKLNKISPKKATLLEKKINNGIKMRKRCIELATGAKPLKNEKNTLCPQFVK